MRLKIGSKKYKIINSIELEKSSRELKYTDIVIDFRGGRLEDLPVYFQELQVLDKNNKVIFTGYVESYKLPTLNKINGIQNELNITLMTPRGILTKKTVTIVTTDKTLNVINRVLQPLYNEGYILKDYNLDDKAITVSLIARSIEDCMKNLSTALGFWWYINEKKEIFIYSTDYLFNKPVIKSININNYKDELKGFISIEPLVEGSDYANIINLKNARIFYNIFQNNVSITMKNGDTLEFENPVDISYETAKRLNADNFFAGTEMAVDNLMIHIENSSEIEAYITSGLNVSGEIKNGLNYKNIGKTDDENKMFTLVMDSMFTNLATGLKYNGENNIIITAIFSETALRYSTVKLINWHEIEINKGKITQTGQIEKTIDANEKWFTVQEAIDFIRNKFIENNKTTNQIILVLDKDNNIEIGDRIEINLPELYTVGNFIVTDIKQSKTGNNPVNYTIELRNTAVTENYANLFQDELTSEEQTNQIDTEYIVEYAEEETIVESHTIEQDTGGNYEN